jgi:hypothetical protein
MLAPARNPVGDAAMELVIPVLVLVLVRLYTHVRHMRQTARALTEHIWSPHVATTIIGIAFVVTTAAQQNWTYSEVLSDLAHGVTSGLHRKVFLGVALLAGAILGGVTAGRFKIGNDRPHPNCSSLRGRHTHGDRSAVDPGRKYWIGVGRAAPSLPVRVAV